MILSFTSLCFHDGEEGCHMSCWKHFLAYYECSIIVNYYYCFVVAIMIYLKSQSVLSVSIKAGSDSRALWWMPVAPRMKCRISKAWHADSLVSQQPLLSHPLLDLTSSSILSFPASFAVPPTRVYPLLLLGLHIFCSVCPEHPYLIPRSFMWLVSAQPFCLSFSITSS